ncbi:hypothetical protein NDU88_001621 [Pleurodeles waltl]|uniref:Uncharacterized protein n=1 Tax=Pleurodeles waltl TaxID=8319 RepID=A0AAV7MNZ5_PLEWA|nr:hypothetical protein NDU88_001621 [Pleurodeles waltl]
MIFPRRERTIFSVMEGETSKQTLMRYVPFYSLDPTVDNKLHLHPNEQPTVREQGLFKWTGATLKAAICKEYAEERWKSFATRKGAGDKQEESDSLFELTLILGPKGQLLLRTLRFQIEETSCSVIEPDKRKLDRHLDEKPRHLPGGS